jgi:hypothetical protein
MDDITVVGVVEIDGRPYTQFSNGQVLPVVSGGADDDEGDEGDEGEEGESGGGGGKGPQWTAEQNRHIKRIATREKGEGREAGSRAVLKELGFEDPSKADLKAIKAILDKARADEEKSLSDTEKARRDAETDRSTVAQEREALALERVETKAERALTRMGLKVDQDDDEKAERQIRRAIKLLDLDSSADAGKVKEAVEDLMEDMPQLFTDEESDDDQGTKEKRKPASKGEKPPARRSDPGRPQGRKPAGTTKDRAQAILEKRHPQLAKKD